MEIYTWRALEGKVQTHGIAGDLLHSIDSIIYLDEKVTLIVKEDNSLIVDASHGEDNAPILCRKQSLVSRLQQKYANSSPSPMVPYLLDVKIIACSSCHCLFGTLDSVFSLGQGTYGQLGLGDKILSVCIPQLVTFPDGESPRSLAVSDYHSCVVTSPNGILYTFGCGAFYRLGHGDDHDVFVPRRVESLMAVGTWLPNGQSLGIEKVSCSIWHTLVLTSGIHDVYSWGWNNFGQCSDKNDDVSEIDELPQPKRPKIIHSTVLPPCNLAESSNVAVPTTIVQQKKKMIIFPERLTSLDVLDEGELEERKDIRILDIACGHRFSAFLTACGDVLIIGQFGSSEIDDVDPGVDWWSRTFSSSSKCFDISMPHSERGLRYLHRSGRHLFSAKDQSSTQNPSVVTNIVADQWSLAYICSTG